MMTATQKSSDRELIFHYQNGNDKAFEELLSRHQNKIYTSILLMVKDASTADDLFQETFIRIVDKLRGNHYNDEGKFLPWALRVAYNLCVDYFRKSKRTPSNPTSADYEVSLYDKPEGNNIEAKLDQTETFESIQNILFQLPPEQRDVVILRHYSELSFKDIADLTDVSINTALGRMRYALLNMKKIMSDNEINFN